MINYDSYFLKFTRACWDVVSREVPEYSSKYSRKDYTLQQHVAMLCLKIKFKKKYREIVDLVGLMPDVREIIGLEKIPHHTTIDKVFLKLKNLVLSILFTATAGKKEPIDGSIDGTGFDRRHSSRHYTKRCKLTIRSLKVSLLIDVKNLKIHFVHITTTRKHDTKIMLSILKKTKQKIKIIRGDKGYDAKEIRDYARSIGIRPLIPHRDFLPIDKMHNARMNKKDYNKRVFNETVNSMLKRKYGDYVSSVNWWNQFKEILLMCIVHNIERNCVFLIGFLRS
jgi:IS5 family transposase